MGRVGRGFVLLAIAGVPACLELNPTYVDDDAASTDDVQTSSASTDASGGMEGEGEGGSSSGAPVDCTPDMYDPNSFEEPADMGGTMVTAVRLEGVDDEDWYKSFLEPPAPTEVYARTLGADLQVCFFAECDGVGPAPITKCSDDPDASPNYDPGCCGIGSVGLEYDCGGSTAITVHVRVDGGGDQCPGYDLEIGFQEPQ